MFILEEETKSIKAIRKLEVFLSWWAALGGGGGVVAVAADKFLEKSLGKVVSLPQPSLTKHAVKAESRCLATYKRWLTLCSMDSCSPIGWHAVIRRAGSHSDSME